MSRGVKGSRHHRWCSGIGRHKDGYVKIRAGKGHPIADRNGWCYLHQLVWWAAGRVVPKGFILHHKNEDKADCRIENIELITRSEHNRHHNKTKSVDPATGRFVGKKAAGRLLDGRTWDEFPEVRP